MASTRDNSVTYTSKFSFEELIEDPESFKLMLDGAFNSWPGVYNVYLPAKDNFLYRTTGDARFQAYCGCIRSSCPGKAGCKVSDKDASKKAQAEKKALVYTCHAGLQDIAIPIFVGLHHVATIFCGQFRSSDEAIDKHGFSLAIDLASTLSLSKDNIIKAWNMVPRLSNDTVSQMITKVLKLTNYITRIGNDRLQLKSNLIKESRRIKEIEVVERISGNLRALKTEMPRFWLDVNSSLRDLAETVDAKCCAILMQERDNEHSSIAELSVKSSFGLPSEISLKSQYNLDARIIAERNSRRDTPLILPFHEVSNQDTLCAAISRYAPTLAKKIENIAFVRILFGEEHVGLLLLFSSLDRSPDAIPLREEGGVLRQVALSIGTAWHNCKIYQERLQEIPLRRTWLRRVTHQLIAPLHGLQGYAEDARLRLSRWRKQVTDQASIMTTERISKFEDEMNRWENSFDSVVWTAHYAARLAHNLAWTVYGKTVSIDMEIAEDLNGILIGCARDFQGIARDRKIKRVYVDTATFRPLLGRAMINADLFRQAIGNLIDNAVKYAYEDTDITLAGSTEMDKGIINITNIGIRIKPDDICDIFKEGKRTIEARRKAPAGTGIGLSVAKDIIQLHGGDIIVKPSIETQYGWKTIFSVYLPLQ